MNKYRLVTMAVIVLLLAACRRGPESPPALLPDAAPTLQPTPTLAVPAAVESPAEVALEANVIPAAAPVATFDGTFEGYLNGDNGSSAPVSFTLAQDGETVNGTISIGDGLFLDGGNCGATGVPAGVQAASGSVDPANPGHLDADATVMVQGLSITIDLDADLAADGQTLTAQATIDLPLLCGRDPVISGAFTRAN